MKFYQFDLYDVQLFCHSKCVVFITWVCYDVTNGQIKYFKNLILEHIFPIRLYKSTYARVYTRHGQTAAHQTFSAVLEANSLAHHFVRKYLEQVSFSLKNECNFLCVARGAFYLLNLARGQKSLATTAIQNRKYMLFHIHFCIVFKEYNFSIKT